MLKLGRDVMWGIYKHQNFDILKSYQDASFRQCVNI